MSILIGRKKIPSGKTDKLGGVAVSAKNVGYGSKAFQRAKEERRLRAKMKKLGKTIKQG